MAKPESVFWQQIKKNIKGISFTRLESWASLGVPEPRASILVPRNFMGEP
jgi:hypothetical protein